MTIEWKPIDEAPEDEDILLKQHFNGISLPLIVIGEVITFKEKLHYLWKGPYEDTVKVYLEELGGEFLPTHWASM